MRQSIRILMVLFTISLTLPLTAYGHGGDATKIHSCVIKTSGVLRIVGANETCRQGETPLHCNGVRHALLTFLAVSLF